MSGVRCQGKDSPAVKIVTEGGDVYAYDGSAAVLQEYEIEHKIDWKQDPTTGSRNFRHHLFTLRCRVDQLDLEFDCPVCGRRLRVRTVTRRRRR